MLNNKDELIEQFTNQLNENSDEYSADHIEMELRITSNHNVVVCSDPLSEENIPLYVDVFEYAKVTEHFGTTDLDKLGSYKPSQQAIDGYADLFGRYGEFDGVSLTVETTMTPYFDFSF